MLLEWKDCTVYMYKPCQPSECTWWRKIFGQLEWIHVTPGFLFDKGQTKPWNCEDHMQIAHWANLKSFPSWTPKKGHQCLQRLEQWENLTESNKFQFGVKQKHSISVSNRLFQKKDAKWQMCTMTCNWIVVIARYWHTSTITWLLVSVAS